MKVPKWLLVAGSFVGVACVNGCLPEPFTPTNIQTATSRAEMEKFSGLKLPAKSQILLAISDSGHDGTKFKKWIALSSKKPTLPRAAISDDNRILLEQMQKAIPSGIIGNPLNRKYEFSSWKNKQGDWNASVVETDKGFYLSLENIVLG